MARLTKNPIMEGISREHVIDYMIDFMGIVGAPAMFESKEEDVMVEMYRGKLPDDLVELIAVRDGEKVLPMISHTDSVSRACEGYKVQGGVIYTTKERCLLRVAYNAVPVDSDGLPKVLDNASFLRALEAYIKKQYYMILVETGKLSANIMNIVNQEYAWAVGDLSSEVNRLSLPMADLFARRWRDR